MIKFYFHPSPNPAKVALFLEESGLPYEMIPVDTRKGEQHHPEFLAINPNGKTPAIVDGDATIFDSNAILMYLAEKTGKFLPENTPAARGQFLSWMMFVASGVGPYSGQAVHFRHAAPKGLEYAFNRYAFEANRHWSILDAQLAKPAHHRPPLCEGGGVRKCRIFVDHARCTLGRHLDTSQRARPHHQVRDFLAAGGAHVHPLDPRAHFAEREQQPGAKLVYADAGDLDLRAGQDQSCHYRECG